MPAPSHLSREDAFKYHLTTRNFFAWMFEKPLVGSSLSEALIALLERMNEYRPDEGENQDDVLVYLDGQGYTDFRECPDHALAVLQFAEKFEIRELWTDAFVHSTGMNDTLSKSDEFAVSQTPRLKLYTHYSPTLKSISRISKALIYRAHLEMELRLERTGKQLANFLEEELSSSYLGLSKEAQVHLDRFRSFLHSHYVGKYGYWPPTAASKKSVALPKSVCQTMYFDFRSLYDYLLDPNSSCSLHDNRPADGGICVLQNVKAFDERHKYDSLDHPLPLVPQYLAAIQSTPSGISKLFASKQVKANRRMANLLACSTATNSGDIKVMESSLVREYFRFEREWTIKEEEKISSTDARKVRWILIYAVLQTLISVTRVPKDVRDTEDVSYPLCCQIAGTPPWKVEKKAQTKDERSIQGKSKPSTNATTGLVDPSTIRRSLTPKSIPFHSILAVDPLFSRKAFPNGNTAEIQPDLDLKPAIKSELKPDIEYFTSRSIQTPQRSPSRPRQKAMPLPIREPSLGRRLSMNRTISVTCPQPRRSAYCEILVQGYGNGRDGETPPVPAHPEGQSAEHDSADASASNPTTPGSLTEGGSDSGDSSGWSPKDGDLPAMDHVSIAGSVSVYGDNASVYPNDDDQGQGAYEMRGRTLIKGGSVDCFRNPEVDQYLLA